VSDPRTSAQRLHVAARAGRPDWFRITNKAGTKTAEVLIYDEIGGWFGTPAADLVKEIRALDVDEIQLHINSPGGDAFDAIAITNTLRSHKARVVATVDGVAASAASMVAMAGDEIVMGPNSEMMIHDAWGGCVGPAADMRDMGDRLDHLSDNIASMYAARGGTAKQWRAAMLAETWYSAQEAVDAGLADRVDTKEPEGADTAKDRFDLSLFAFAGRAAAPTPFVPRTPPAPPDASVTHKEGAKTMTDSLDAGLRERLGVTDDQLDEAGLLAELDRKLAEQTTDSTAEQTAAAEQAAADAATAAEQTAAAASAAALDGMKVIPEAAWAEMQANAARGNEAHERLRVQDRDTYLVAAAREGRVPPGKGLDSFRAWYDRDAAACRAEVDGTAKSTYLPIAALGYDTGGDTTADPATGDDYWFAGTVAPTSQKG
jgi:ATP-dependent protease ClpP protease subunit